jgi:anthranilate phosphoribosyltransferase
MLGPLVNPANPDYRISGVYSSEAGRIYSYFLQAEKKKYIVLHSLDGYDEVSLTSPVKIFSNNGETMVNFREMGFRKLKPENISGGKTMEDSAAIFYSVLKNEGTPEQQSVIVANAAMAISCIAKPKNLPECIDVAREMIYSGKAYASFKKLLDLQ